jgi:hypothetical protein
MVLTSGLVVLASTPATATQGEEHKVWVCHATSSDTNPYVVLSVDVASVKYQGHLQHRTTPNKKWKSDDTWNGVAHKKNDPKADLIETMDFTGFPQFCDYNPRPETVERPEMQTTESCELGHGVRNGIRYIEYEWNDGDEAAGVDGFWEPEPESEQEVIWGEWKYTAYTPEEYARLCQTPQPPTKDPVTVPVSEQQSSCERGVEQRTGTQTTTYTWNSSKGAFDEQVGPVSWGSWTFVRDLTDAEFETLGCRPDQPEPVVVELSDERMGCDIGVQSRDGTQTTSYSWNVETRDYDTVVGPEVWGDWVKVRNLTSAEALDLDCIAGEQTVKPKPQPKPTVAGVQVVAPPAAAPTAVAAGVGGGADASPVQLVGQSLTGLGVLTLVAAGWLMLNRRTRGVHES